MVHIAFLLDIIFCILLLNYTEIYNEQNQDLGIINTLLTKIRV